ncbi:MAG: hypothetical protein HY083_01770 [Gammaproteobacteria bacterium]|nr:hypothetical protein [Gammaproteobacteria bacterium]
MHHDTGWRWNVAIAFAAVYLIWDSTCLAIRVGVQELPATLIVTTTALWLVWFGALGTHGHKPAVSRAAVLRRRGPARRNGAGCGRARRRAA